MNNASWNREQLLKLAAWISGNPHRWPTEQIVRALRNIAAGDRDWQARVSEVDDDTPEALETFEHLGGETATVGSEVAS